MMGKKAVLKTYDNVHSEFQSFMKTAPLQKMNMSPTTTSEGKATFSFPCEMGEFS